MGGVGPAGVHEMLPPPRMRGARQVLDCAYPVVPGIGPEATSPATFPKAVVASQSASAAGAALWELGSRPPSVAGPTRSVARAPRIFP